MNNEYWESLQKSLDQLAKSKERLDQLKEVQNHILKKRIKPINKEPIKSCICCGYWKIQEEEKHLLIGYCKKNNGTKTDYGFICDEWKKI